MIAGAFAGATTAVFVSPLDVARVRIQVSRGKTDAGIFGSRLMGRMLRDEGPMSLYRGLSATMIALVPNWVTYFVTYSQFKQHAQPLLLPTIGHIGTDVIAAVVAGAASTFVTHPLWLVKARMQVQGLCGATQPHPGAPGAINTPPEHLPGVAERRFRGYHRGVFHALKHIVVEEGPRALYHGFIPQMFGLIHVAIQFPLYEAIKRKMKAYNQQDEHHAVNAHNAYHHSSMPLTTAQIVVASTVSKIVACAVAYPHEVLRSRFQTQDFLPGDLHKDVRYTSMKHAVTHILKSEGIPGLYRGLGVTLTRSVPSCVVTFVVYERVMQMLTERSETR
jgi:solute carrier family 25 folate transporter 32